MAMVGSSVLLHLNLILNLLLQPLRTEGKERRKELPTAEGGALLPKGNHVLLASYESMMQLGDVYLKMFYEALEIDTGYVPNVKNGNTKYVKQKKK